MKISFDDTLNAINGKNYTGKIPFAFWKHFPEKDIKLNDIVTSHLDFQKQIQSDLIKFSPNSKFCLLDFGLEIGKEYDEQTGSYITKKYPINSISDWEKIDEIDPLDGNLGLQLSAFSKFSKQIKNKPTMMTVFLPMMVAEKLVSGNNLINHLNQDTPLVKDRLKVIQKVMTEFSLASLDEGSDGLFLATQHTAKADDWNETLWMKYIYPIDNELIKTVNKRALFTVLHFHGSNIFFEKVIEKMKVTAFNWHPFNDLPSVIFNNNRNKFNGGLIGGFDVEKFQQITNSENEIEKFVESIIEIHDSYLHQLIIAPGCVLSQNVSLDKLNFFLKKLKETKFVIK